MTDEITMPVPDRSGSSGNQVPSVGTEIFTAARPLHGLHIASTVEGIAARNSRAFGGDVATALIGAATRQMSQDYSDVKTENRRLTDRVEAIRDELEATRTKNAVLSERIRAEGKYKHLRNLCITIGTSSIGVGIALSRSSQDSYSAGAFVFGVLRACQKFCV
jgi:hypothetical protein